MTPWALFRRSDKGMVAVFPSRRPAKGVARRMARRLGRPVYGALPAGLIVDAEWPDQLLAVILNNGAL